MVSLIRSYAEGRTDDEAFREALGMDMAAFGAAWLDDLGAAVPTRYGPQSAPPGPIPSAWLVQAGASAQPAASGDEPPASARASAPPGDGATSSGGGDALVLVLALAAIVIAGAGAVVIARRRRIDPGSSA